MTSVYIFLGLCLLLGPVLRTIYSECWPRCKPRPDQPVHVIVQTPGFPILEHLLRIGIAGGSITPVLNPEGHLVLRLAHPYYDKEPCPFTINLYPDGDVDFISSETGGRAIFYAGSGCCKTRIYDYAMTELHKSPDAIQVTYGVGGSRS